MYTILVLAILSGPPRTCLAGEWDAPSADAATALDREVQTGSLIFSKGDCLAVKVLTASRYTHVGCVVVRDERAVVYDSTVGAGVRQQSLSQFLVTQAGADVSVYYPAKPFTPQQAEQFEQYLVGQLGRPYAITHHLTGEHGEGLHCSEYAASALAACALLDARRPAHVSPASLLKRISHNGMYVPAATLEGDNLLPEPATCPGEASWCSRAWFNTRQCTNRCYLKLRAWFCCK